jgi:cyclopropane-fatty-acyl-phospholipid synthase
VFPDGETLHLSRVQLALERAGFETDHVEGFREDYAETLRHWIERLDQNLGRAEQLAGGERLRVWRLYLRAARNGFVSRRISVYQVNCRLPDSGSTNSSNRSRVSQTSVTRHPLSVSVTK